MTILERIIAYKKKELAVRKNVLTKKELEKFPHFSRKCKSLSGSLLSSSTGIIAEHKRKSPSKSVINDKLDLQDVVKGYENAGVAGLSVLTDTPYFGGSLDDLMLAREVVDLPILRKDFTIDSYQLYEAKAYGADLILLIAACLSRDQIAKLSATARELGLEVLLEIHNLEELKSAPLQQVNIIGVNNRNLKTFNVSIENSKELSRYIPSEFLKISESGISDPKAVKELRGFGYKGFLVGENFMRTDNPGQSAANFINEING